MRRRPLNRRQSQKNFNRGNRVSKRNSRSPIVQRGGYRI